MKLHVSFDTEIPDAAHEKATEAHIQEWLQFALHAGPLHVSNPLYSIEVEARYGSVSWRPQAGKDAAGF